MGAGALTAAASRPSKGTESRLPIDKAAKVPARLVQAVREHAIPLTGVATDFASILHLSAHASYVLIGEASHGTHEFYATRAQLTRQLIEQQQFNAVVIEADWPAAYRVDRFVRGKSGDTSAEQALSGFNEFPEWMWRNVEVRDFVAWLRAWNQARPQTSSQTGFYGMDLYSLFRSRDAVLRYAASVSAEEAAHAAEHYERFQRAGSNPQTYGQLAAFGWRKSAAKGARQQFEHITRLTELPRTSAEVEVADAAFDAQQNARVVKNVEEYYREMYNPGGNTWNLRDRHMADTLDAVAEHLRRRDGYARLVVWAHNSHLGDARATEARWRGDWNVGQLIRERHPNEAVLVGFSTSTGTVMASSNWGERGAVRQIQPALPHSYERAFHESGLPAFLLPLQDEAVAKEFQRPLLQRAIGVVYRPKTERQSHYFEAHLAKQFDAVIHFEQTRAVQPLDSERRKTASRPASSRPAKQAA